MNLLKDLLARLPEAKTEITEGKSRKNGVYELVEKYIEEKEMHHFEGHGGVRNLTHLIADLDDSYRDLEKFLADNSGCQQAMVEWIMDQKSEQWADSLAKALGIPDEDK